MRQPPKSRIVQVAMSKPVTQLRGQGRNIASSFTEEVYGVDFSESDFVGNKLKCSGIIKYF